MCVLVRGFDFCFRSVLGLLGSDSKILIDFGLCNPVLRPSIAKPSVSIHLATAPRNDFANPVTKPNANCKNYDTWEHLRVYTPHVDRRFKSSAITLIGAKFPL